MTATRAILFVLLAVSPLRADPPDSPFAAAIEQARPRVAKVYGGKVGTVAAYGCGVMVSADGRIVTALTAMLEDSQLRVVLDDGRRFPAKIVARDDMRQLAELKIDAADLPFFEVKSSAHVQPGDWVIAAANPFKVAEGPEPVSFAAGTLAARAPLAARRRTQDVSYDGTVLITDVIVATNGSAGGALIDASGQLVGVIGKAVKSSRTNTWLNYALPVEEIAAFLDRVPPRTAGGAETSVGSRPSDGASGSAAEKPGEFTSNFPALGLYLFNIGGRTRPAYVERVRSGSPAFEAGVRAGDLILSLANDQTATCDEFRIAVARLTAGQRVSIVVKRGEEVKSLELAVPEPKR